jgi:hypothetical protein
MQKQDTKPSVIFEHANNVCQELIARLQRTIASYCNETVTYEQAAMVTSAIIYLLQAINAVGGLSPQDKEKYGITD